MTSSRRTSPCSAFLRILCVSVLGLIAASARADSVIVSNFGEPVRFATPIANPEFWAAQSFSADTTYALTTIAVLIGDATGVPDPVIELRSSDGLGQIDLGAGGLLTTFAAPDLSGAASARIFTPNQPVNLVSGTQYWFIVGTNEGGFGLSYSQSNASTGPGQILNFADSSDAGASWNYRDPEFPYFIEVRGVVVPEPATLLLLGLGLGGLAWRSRKRAALAISLAALAGPASAVPIAVANPSFEEPVLADAGFEFGNVTGWETFSGASAGSGGANPPANTYTNAAGSGTPLGGEGSQIAFSFNGQPIRQTLGDDGILLGNAIYTLTVAIGQRLDGNQYGVDGFGGYELAILAGNVVIAQEANADDFTPVPGAFVDRTLSFDSATVSPIYYGLPLTIRLVNTVPGGVTDFDNVRFDGPVVPEPGSLALLSLGSVGLGIAGRRRSAR